MIFLFMRALCFHHYPIPFLRHTFFFFYIVTLAFLLSILHLPFCIFLCPFPNIKILMHYRENPFALRK